MEANGSDYSLDYEHNPGYGDLQQELAQRQHYTAVVYTFIAGPLMLAGFIGNAIAFRTLGRLTHQNAMTFFLRGLAIVDTCVLLLSVAFLCPFLVYLLASPALAKLNPYLSTYVVPIHSIAIVVNVWTTVVIGMNRYIALCRPLDATRLCTTSRARKHMICIILLSIVYGLPGFLFSKITKRANGFAESVPYLAHNIWYVYIYLLGGDLLFRSLIPFCLLLFFCVRIITALRASRKQQLDRHGGRQVDRKITSMLLILLGVFLVCSLLVFVVYLFIFFGFKPLVFSFIGPPITYLAYILNSSVNCLIYLGYMGEFRKLLCERCNQRSSQNQDLELA